MNPKKSDTTAPSSFRDPCGFIFHKDGSIYRQVNKLCQLDYDFFISSGLYRDLTAKSLLIHHDEVDVEPPKPKISYKIIRPDAIPFISYPYEWCFSQLKDSALMTLEVQKKALEYDMTLKDASAYNIQFLNCRPIHIDTLSFERYVEGKPWGAYLQFCQHFLAPLSIMSYTDIRLNQMLRIHLDGIPLDLASNLLPRRTLLSFHLLTHIHLHGKSQKHFSNRQARMGGPMRRTALLGLIDSLEKAVNSLRWKPKETEWNDYYNRTNYSLKAQQHKRQVVSGLIRDIKPTTVWDLGANTGVFSRIAAENGALTVSFDMDPACVEKNYLQENAEKNGHILPLQLDLTNPSPAIGWGNTERMSLMQRGPADAVLALAIIHHLAIANNLPFCKIAHFMSEICDNLIIEFIPKSDSQLRRLLASRDDIFIEYNQASFEHEFSAYFTVDKAIRIEESERIIYSMKNKRGCL